MASKGRKNSKALPAVLPDGGLAVLSPAEAEKISLLNSVAKLQVDGLKPAEIAHALGVSLHRVKASMDDPRMRIALARARAVALGDAAVNDALELARAEYRLSRAWEVLDAEMDALDPWIRHQAALAVIAASAKANEGKGGTEIVLTPDLVFDDQDLQDDVQDTSDSPELVVDDAY